MPQPGVIMDARSPADVSQTCPLCERRIGRFDSKPSPALAWRAAIRAYVAHSQEWHGVGAMEALDALLGASAQEMVSEPEPRFAEAA